MTEHRRKTNDAGAARTERKSREDKKMSDDEADLRRREQLGKVDGDCGLFNRCVVDHSAISVDKNADVSQW